METEEKTQPSTEANPPVTTETLPKKEEYFIPREQFKGLQRELNASHAKQREAEERAARLQDRFDTLEENQARTLDLLEAQAGVTETEKLSRVAALKQQREKPAANPVLEMRQKDIADLLEEAKIEDKDSRLEKAVLLWQAGKVDDSVKEVRRITREATKIKEAAATAEHIRAEVQKGLQEAIEKAGLKKFPGGEPAGGALAYRQIADQFTENPNDPVIREAYLKARRARGL